MTEAGGPDIGAAGYALSYLVLDVEATGNSRQMGFGFQIQVHLCVLIYFWMLNSSWECWAKKVS